MRFLAMWASPLVVVPWFAASSPGREPMNGKNSLERLQSMENAGIITYTYQQV
jgi:hypothetical protein